MTNKIPNRKVLSDTLLENAKTKKDLLVLTSDSRGSALLNDFANELPEQFIEVGIAEQNIVGVASGLAHSGKIPFVVSPASFLSSRSIEQIKVDVCYSNTNVKLIGISGGVSYGSLGMTHHSLQDLAMTRAIPNLQVIIPADRFETKRLTEMLIGSSHPAYVRLGRNPVEDSYPDDNFEFVIGKANTMLDYGEDVTIFAVGEMVRVAMDAAELLNKQSILVRVINMHTIKPIDEKAIIRASQKSKLIVSVEEHSIYGGLGSAIAEVLAPLSNTPKHIIKGFPDEPAVTGNSQEVFKHYGFTKEGISKLIIEELGV